MKRTTILFASAWLAITTTTACEKDKARPPTPGASAQALAEAGPQRTAAKAVERNDITVTSRSPEAARLFVEGRDLQENFRASAAADKFAGAIELDPKFALAHAYLAVSIPGEAAKASMKRALELADKVPLAEKLVIKALAAKMEGDAERAAALHGKLVEQAPGDWRAHYWLGLDHQNAGRTEAAANHLERAVALEPKAGVAYNNLAYLYAGTGDFDRAIAAIDRYAALEPHEPNPLDSKGEILLMAGKLDRSEAAFAEAASQSDDFTMANTGLAAARMYRGDWPGAIDALNAYVAAATNPWEAQKGRTELAWAKLGADDLRGALAMTDTMAKVGARADDPTAAARAHLLAAQLLIEAGAPKRALAPATAALDDTGAPDWMAPWAQFARLQAALGVDDVETAETALAAIAGAEMDGKKTAELEDLLAHARGAVALHRGDLPAAAKHLSKIQGKTSTAYRGHWLRVKALDKLGKKAQAEKLRRELAGTYRRSARDAVTRNRFAGSGEI